MNTEGTLRVNLKSDSYFISENMPIEVRDSKMALIHRTNNEREFELPVGLYEVSAFLEDGRKHSQLVQVKEGENTPVEFSIDTAYQSKSVRQISEDEPETLSVADLITQPDEEPTYHVPIQLIEVDGAALEHQTPTGFVFKCTNEPNSVPTALMLFGDKQYKMSLPLSNDSRKPEGNTCVVGIEQTKAGPHLHAWIAPARTIANTLQNMLASGYVIHAGEVADNAVDLLRYKYSDPTGAALGALILYKVGRLKSRVSWVENLTRDFDWLPDGKVLLAILNFPHNKDEALDYALKASQQRMLYTESYSLLLGLLRRWPQGYEDNQIKEAIKRLSLNSPYIDWDSICLSHSIEGEND